MSGFGYFQILHRIEPLRSVSFLLLAQSLEEERKGIPTGPNLSNMLKSVE